MKDTPKQSAEDRPPQLRLVGDDEVCPEVDGSFQHGERTEQEEAEEFWSGRNHAMRHSARVAA